MAFQTKGIKNRLKSIRNTKKITRTMELVSAAKMRRAVEATTKTRPYTAHLWSIINSLKVHADLLENHDLKKFFEIPAEVLPYQRHQKKIRTTMILFSSNRGLCGGFNSHLVKKVASYFRKRRSDETISVIGIGTKGVPLLGARRISTDFAYRKEEGPGAYQSIVPIAKEVYKKFLEGETDKIILAYTAYRSSSKQKPTIKQILPLPYEKATEVEGYSRNHLFEPSEEELMQALIPRVIEMQMFQALLDSNASEHCARMVAMKNAKDAATEMSDSLSLSYNRARQASITQEIAEISAGFAAIS